MPTPELKLHNNIILIVMKLLKIATAALFLIGTSVVAQKSSIKKAEYQKYWAKRAQQGVKDYTPMQP